MKTVFVLRKDFDTATLWMRQDDENVADYPRTLWPTSKPREAREYKSAADAALIGKLYERTYRVGGWRVVARARQ